MTGSEDHREPPRESIRYDLILIAIPVLFVGAYAVLQPLPMGQTTTITISSLLSGLPIGVGLFINPPRKTK